MALIAMVTVIVLLTLAHGCILVFEIPVLTELDGWFFPFTQKYPLGDYFAFVFFTFSGSILWICTCLRRHRVLLLLLLVLFGTLSQFGFAWLEGRGLSALQDRIVHSGHAEFARLAVQQDDVFMTLKNYEDLIDKGELGVFTRSKPPGQFLFYMASERVASWISGAQEKDHRLQSLQKFATFTWPLVACLVLVPLYFVGKKYVGETGALLACVFYATVPSVMLITLHADQVLFPLLFMTSLWCAQVAFERRSRCGILMTGIFIYVSTWFSFVLLLAIPFILVLGYFELRKNQAAGLSTCIFFFVSLAIGMVLSDVIFRIGLNYDVALRYRLAMAHHMAWKNLEFSVKTVVMYGMLNWLEYFVWLGMPVALLGLVAWARAGLMWILQQQGGVHILALTLLGVLLLLTWMGKTRGEVARLWLFLTPLYCLIAADTLVEHLSGKRLRLVAAGVWALQWTTIGFTKIHMDFW